MTSERFAARWFRALTEADTRGLSVFRIVHGAFVAAYVAWTPMFGRLEAFFSDDGVVPVAVLDEIQPEHAIYTLLRFAHTQTEAFVAFAIGFAICVAYAAGLFTRVMSVLVVVVLLSIHHRVPFAMSGAMMIMNSFAILATFLPLGRHYSVDAWLARRRGTVVVPERIRSIAMLAIHLQFFVIYAFNVAHKHGSKWIDGTAVHYVLANSQFAWPVGIWVGRHLPAFVIAVLTYGTLVTEAAIALAVVSPFRRQVARRFAMVAILVLHTAFIALIDVGPFLVSLVPPAFLLIAAEEGSLFERRPSVAAMAEGPIQSARGTRAVREFLAASMLVLILLLNRRDNGIMRSAFGEAQYPAVVEEVATALFTNQRWSMFSNNPMLDSAMLLFVVELDDGRIVDARTRREVDFDRLDGRPLHPDTYWQLVDGAFTHGNRRNLFDALVHYVARRPQVEGWPGSPIVQEVAIHQITSTIPEPGGTRDFGSKVLYVKRLRPVEQRGQFIY